MYFEKSQVYKKDEVKRLVSDASQAEGCKPFIKICQDDNFHKDIISNFYVYLEDKLVGYLNIFNPTKSSAEVFSVVHPQHRRLGIFKKLLLYANKEFEKHEIGEVLYLNEACYKSGADCLKHLGFIKMFSEYTMKYCGEKTFSIPDADIKMMGPDDLDICISAAQTIYKKGYEDVRVMVENNILSPRNTMIALMDGKSVAGFCSFEIDDNKASVYGFAVLPNYRGKGLSKVLLAEILRQIQSEGVDDIYLEVDSENEIAYKLYKNFGFKSFQQIDYYARGISK